MAGSAEPECNREQSSIDTRRTVQHFCMNQPLWIVIEMGAGLAIALALAVVYLVWLIWRKPAAAACSARWCAVIFTGVA